MSNHYLRADLITQALAERHKGDVFMTQVRTGPTQTAKTGEQRILDAVGIKRSWSQPLYHGYEIKVSRADFKKDDKWPLYRNFCHSLSFVYPKGMIQPEDLPEDIGLIYFNEQTNQLRTVRKAAYRPIEIPRSMLEYIIMSKTDSDRHPFFSTQREQLEAWVDDRISRRELSRHVQDKLRHQLKELEDRERIIDDRQWLSEQEKRIWTEIRGELAKRGVDLESYKWRENLQSVLVGNVPTSTEGWIEQLFHDLWELQRLTSSPVPEKAGSDLI